MATVVGLPANVKAGFEIFAWGRILALADQVKVLQGAIPGSRGSFCHTPEKSNPSRCAAFCPGQSEKREGYC